MSDLRQRIEEAARSPILLVATDYDGTLAPIVNDPKDAKPIRESIVALHALAELPQTGVAIISGRALRDLSTLAEAEESVHLVGSHGSEFDPDLISRLTPEEHALRDRLDVDLRAIAGAHSGFFLEQKPASIAFHYRGSDEESAAAALAAIQSGPAQYVGVVLKHGKRVIELSVLDSDKGKALRTLRSRLGATVVVFIGDDLTDEDAFASLSGPDVGIKVGPEPTKARYRVEDCFEVARVLASLAELRQSWLAGADAVAIEKHSLLSDQRTTALVTPDARIVWMCAPRIDSTSLFAELLGGPAAGYFSVKDAADHPPLRQTYLADTFLLRTEWPTFSVTDYFDCSAGRPFQRASRSDLIRVIEGQGRVSIDFAPRVDFGRQQTRLKTRFDGLEVDGAIDPIVLRAPGLTWKIREDGAHQSASAEVELGAGPLVLELRYGLSNSQELLVPEPRRRDQTVRFWTTWADQLRLPPLRPDLVKRSAMVLKALCYGPTGAIAAAATTSLPEAPGGVRNWDYRYCWIRDAALAGIALAGLSATGPGLRLLDWVLGILDRDESPESLRPVYSVTGGHLGTEAEIGNLPGYLGSRPVRIGNAAAHQLQLDVFGPILELIVALAERGASLTTEHWRLTEALIGAVALRWREPDHGIWEVRQQRRNFVHSKVMCWVAVDRALKIAQLFAERQPEEWVTIRGQIAADILEKGWNESLGAFASSYEDPSLDAASLLVGLTGLLRADDPRFERTVSAIEASLRVGPTVYRYRYDDGLPGWEGGFQLCTTWLIEAYAMVGRIDDARRLFEEFTATFGPTGLASEEYCPHARRSLGNFPQVYTHLGLINAATRLASAGVSDAAGCGE